MEEYVTRENLKKSRFIYILLLIQGISYILFLILGQPLISLFEMNDKFFSGEVWRLITAIFVNDASIVDFLTVMVSFLIIGVFLEAFYKKWIMITMFIISGILGNLFWILIFPTLSFKGIGCSLWGLLAITITLMYKDPKSYILLIINSFVPLIEPLAQMLISSIFYPFILVFSKLFVDLIIFGIFLGFGLIYLKLRTPSTSAFKKVVNEIEKIPIFNEIYDLIKYEKFDPDTLETQQQKILKKFAKFSLSTEQLYKIEFNGDVWYRLARIAIKLQQFLLARSLYFRAIKEKNFENYHIAKNGYAWTSFLYNLYDEAEKLYREILKERPDLSLTWNNLGYLLIQKGNVEEGEAAYKKALELDPKNYLALCNQGWQAFKVKDMAEAERKFKQSLEILPEYGWSWHALGELYSNMGRLEESEKALRNAIKYLKKNSDIWYTFGLILEKNNKKDEAKEAFQKALKFAPKNWARLTELKTKLSR
ncbi:MAG: rhomboid family intramembrane serine protease [Candidatus Lokiarchaeota archaeon]|nr:rhomboid family intramembrane serine protease [Candidatus Lokiarchaeota archaeon]